MSITSRRPIVVPSAMPVVRTSCADGVEDEDGPPARPLVSVIIPCYNQAHFVRHAIESVRAQTYPGVELILVNDGSTDDVESVVAGFPWVRSISQENRGLAAARNIGLARCRGDLVVFLDADDRLLPGAVETGVRLLAADPSLGFVAGHSRFITSEGTPLPTEQPLRGAEDPYVALLRRNSIRNPAMVMFRRSALDQAGGFDSRVDACADYEMYLRISRSHPVGFHTAVVAEYRKHGGNMSGNAALMIRQLLFVMREQRPHLTNRAHHEAFRAGRRNIREYYGDLLANQIRERLRTRSGWSDTLADVATLIQCHPRGAAEHVCRKLLCVWRGDETTTQPT
jgi:glycosyltransferase involved in cell wall biosynthesis